MELSSKIDGFLFRWPQHPAFDSKTKHACQAEGDGFFALLRECHGYRKRRNRGSEHFTEISACLVVMGEDALDHGSKGRIDLALMRIKL
jgi:hypothetical protein